MPLNIPYITPIYPWSLRTLVDLAGLDSVSLAEVWLLGWGFREWSFEFRVRVLRFWVSGLGSRFVSPFAFRI